MHDRRSTRHEEGLNQDLNSASAAALNSSAPSASATPPASCGPAAAGSAAERVLAAELSGRSEHHDALSMMMSSMVRMVQAGQSRDSRWQDA